MLRQPLSAASLFAALLPSLQAPLRLSDNLRDHQQSLLTEIHAAVIAAKRHEEGALVQTIPGFGTKTTPTLVACLPQDLRTWGPKQKVARKVQAYFGFDPKLKESGQWRGQVHLSETGHRTGPHRAVPSGHLRAAARSRHEGLLRPAEGRGKMPPRRCQPRHAPAVTSLGRGALRPPTLRSPVTLPVRQRLILCFIPLIAGLVSRDPAHCTNAAGETAQLARDCRASPASPADPNILRTFSTGTSAAARGCWHAPRYSGGVTATSTHSPHHVR